jgi:ABC-type multidrug transport system fused ATPase/permease subunit
MGTHPTPEDLLDTQGTPPGDARPDDARPDDGRPVNARPENARPAGRPRHRFRLSADADETDGTADATEATETTETAADREDEGTAEATGAGESMPALWAGRRRYLLVLLVLLGVFQAVMALVMAFTVDALLGEPARFNAALNAGTAPDGTALDPAAVAQAGTYVPWFQIGILATAVLSIFGARWAERVVGEDLGQDYVHQLRRRLIGGTLAGAGNPSLGVTITRASNDLTAVRNWVSQGIVPLMTSLPLIVVVVVVLMLSNWQIGLAVGLPIVLLALAVPPLAAATLARARFLRRRRGRMSARIADAVRAGESIQAAGGIRRELNALDRDSGKVVDAAVARARITGLVRASTVTAASLSTAAVVVLGSLGMIDAAAVASAMTLLGVMAAPMGEVGRVVEYRQNYRAARRIQAPLLAQAEVLRRAERDREERWRDVPRDVGATGPRGVRIRRLVVQGRRVPMLQAGEGERIWIRSHDPGRLQLVLAALLAGRNSAAAPREDRPPQDTPALEMVVDGYDYTLAPGRRRRTLLGHASARVPLERGTAARAITYRHPRATGEQTRAAIERVGLAAVLDGLPRGAGTRLKNGGDPLTGSQAARLKLGRALMGNPPLLVLEGLDAELDEEGLGLLRAELEDYPGVVLFTAQSPERIAPGHRVWTVDAP